MKSKKSLLVLVTFLMHFCNPVRSAPPFITDDPEPVPYKHGEAYLGSTGNKSKNELYAFLPFFEMDYGAFKDTQLHAIIPFSFDKMSKKAGYYGPGIIELGVKYRIVHETKSFPQIGIFPLLELPTGNSGKRLGSGKTQLFLPLWLQKSWGKKGQEWTAYGGGGYWFNPGKNNKDYCFLGLVVQRQINKLWWTGLEAFYQTKPKIGMHQSFGFNFGVGIKFHKNLQLVYSFGDNIGLGKFLYYASLYYTW